MEKIISNLLTNEYFIIGLFVLLVLIIVFLIVIILKQSKPNQEGIKKTSSNKVKKSEPKIIEKIKSVEKQKKVEEIEPENIEEELIETNEVELVLKKMEEELKSKNAVSFEEEQEESAIISYQELVSTVKKDDDKKFKTSEFISPVYGKDTQVTKKEVGDEFLKELKSFRNNLE